MYSAVAFFGAAAKSGRHGDGVGPALLGGLVLVRSTDPIDLLRPPLPEGLFVSVATPDFVLETKQARAALPDAVTAVDHKPWLDGLVVHDPNDHFDREQRNGRTDEHGDRGTHESS